LSIGYTPSKWGSEFHRLPYDQVLGAGAAGVGKTRVLLMDPIAQAIVEHDRCRDKSHPYHMGWGDSVGRALHLRRTVSELDQSIAWTHQIFPKIDGEAKFSTKDNEWTFASGYKFKFGHCKDRDSWTSYLGWEFTHIGYDELVTFEEEQYDQINTRLRTSDPVLSKMLRIRAMSNPMMPSTVAISVRDPQWVRRRFIDEAPEGKTVLKRVVRMPDGREHAETRMYYPGTLYDNPDKDFVLQYEARLALSPKHIREALLEGNWYYTAGAFWGDVWNKALHVCKPFKVPEDWPMFRSMDWGYKQPGCIHWWAMDGDENLFCVKELTFKGKDVEQVSKLVEEVERELGLWQSEGKIRHGEPSGRSRITGPADTQLWEDRGDPGLTKAAVMERWGVPWCKAEKHAGGFNSRGRKINADKLTFRLKDRRGGDPGVRFFNTCNMAIRTIPMVQTDPEWPDAPADGGQDHWVDSVLYACAFASYGRGGLGGRTKAKRLYDEDDEPMRRRVERGRDGYGSRY
jgi:Terminase large subunit, T4likevirus-type, N-terminal